ncbi:MAG: FtsX-like permease family protein [Candidatus Aminicenantes bacterium]|nr:FtsX-like permease family protein [Candidatus Aminicenantes bacterium]
MIIPRLALRNVLGAGLRTWLKVVVLSFVFVVIIWAQGFINGLNEQAEQAQVEAEYGGGQYWHEKYDPYDPFTLQDAHGRITEPLQKFIYNNQATPILIVQGSIYPKGRLRPILIKGIDPSQRVVSLPSNVLHLEEEDLPVLIGRRMAKSTGLQVGDYVTVQWRDVRGTFDALDAQVVYIMSTTVQSIDNNQIWVPLKKLQMMTSMEDEATLVVIDKNMENPQNISGWTFKNLYFLLSDIRELAQVKTFGSMIIYVILLFLSMLAIFDTQILSIFRRRKEMGTLMALGLTRGKLILLFTLEGVLQGVLAAIVAAIYGVPLLLYSAAKGWTMPQITDSMGFAIGDKLFPVFTAELIIGTFALVLIITTIVSYIPTRKISHLKPTDALRGSLS